MAQPVLIKVYGNIWPADKDFYDSIVRISRDSIPTGNDPPIVEFSGDLIKISFEGIYFPTEEILNFMQKNINPMQKGKLDILDLEDWTLTRYTFINGKISINSAPLNNVLDYSGH